MKDYQYVSLSELVFAVKGRGHIGLCFEPSGEIVLITKPQPLADLFDGQVLVRQKLGCAGEDQFVLISAQRHSCFRLEALMQTGGGNINGLGDLLPAELKVQVALYIGDSLQDLMGVWLDGKWDFFRKQAICQNLIDMCLKMKHLPVIFKIGDGLQLLPKGWGGGHLAYFGDHGKSVIAVRGVARNMEEELLHLIRAVVGYREIGGE